MVLTSTKDTVMAIADACSEKGMPIREDLILATLGGRDLGREHEIPSVIDYVERIWDTPVVICREDGTKICQVEIINHELFEVTAL